MSQPEYIFENGKVYTMVDGQVVSAVHEAEFDDGRSDTGGVGPSGHDSVEMPDPPPEVMQDQQFQNGGEACPQCQNPLGPADNFCPQCGTEVTGGASGGAPGGDPGGGGLGPVGPGGDPGSSVTTPNGLSGQVLGKHAGLWGEEVTVRFENGRIVRLPVNEGMKFSTPKQASAKNPVEELEARLAASVEGDRASLEARRRELHAIQRDAVHRTAKVDYQTQQTLDSIRAQAKAELGDVQAALAHVEQAEAMQAPVAPLEIHPRGTTASMNRVSGDWLDHSLRGMIAEAEATDYEKLMDEGPEALVAGLDAPTLANAGVTRAVAQRYITSHTAAADPAIRKKYESVWLERVEQVRRTAFAQVKEAQRKEASSGPDLTNLPDDSLFL